MFKSKYLPDTNNFEPTEEERTNGMKQPTKAHHAIAKLVKAGYIKVVITTNFDKLLEKAFEDENIAPQVIDKEEDIDGAIPLMHSGATIVKVNGDYLSCKFLNTTEELENYPPKMEKYLKRIFEDFGLITCGWSAKWDVALIEIMNREKNNRYGSFFTYVNEIETSLHDISQKRSGINIRINNADEFFSEINERVISMEKMYDEQIVDKEAFVTRIKRYICKPEYKVELDELIESELKHACDVINENETYDFNWCEDKIPVYFQKHLSAVDKLIPAAIAIVRWGKEENQNVLVDMLQRLSVLRIPKKSNRSSVEYLHLFAAHLLCHSIGVACIYYNKYSLLIKFVKTKALQDYILSNNNLFYLTSYGLYGFGIRYYNGKLISDMVVDNLWTYYKDVFYSIQEFKSCYYAWEYMHSLICKFYMCSGYSVFTEGGYKSQFKNVTYN